VEATLKSGGHSSTLRKTMYLSGPAQNEQTLGDTKLISQSRNRSSLIEDQKVLD
jgi:hypothetical protein